MLTVARDVRPTDVEAGPDQPGAMGAMLLELLDELRLRDRHVVEDPDRAEDERAQQQAAEVQAVAVRRLEEREVGSRRVRERGERGGRGAQEPGQGERRGRPEDRRSAGA